MQFEMSKEQKYIVTIESIIREYNSDYIDSAKKDKLFKDLLTQITLTYYDGHSKPLYKALHYAATILQDEFDSGNLDPIQNKFYRKR